MEKNTTIPFTNYMLFDKVIFVYENEIPFQWEMMGKGRNSAKEVKMERKIIQKVREKETVKVTLIAFAKKTFF